MKIITYNGSYIYFETFKYNSNKNLKNYIDNEDYKYFLDNFDINIILVLGGDGTMLNAISKLKNYKLPFCGINFGNKGFLLNPGFPTNIDFSIKKYPLFELVSEKQKYYSFNEFDIRSLNGRIITLDITIGDCNNISISGDGIIISTPFGSTGYNSSLGGPIIPHNLNAYILTPKAPWKPKGQQPILLKDDKILKINNGGRKNDFIIYSDGKEIRDIPNNFVIKKSSKKISMIIFNEYKQYWENKIYIEQGFNKKPTK